MTQLQAQTSLDGYPVLSAHCTVTPAVVRNEHWLIIKNTLTARHLRLHRELWPVLCQLDGNILLKDWLVKHTAKFGDQRLLGAVLQLQRHGMLSAETMPPTTESFVTHCFSRRNPLMLRVALFDPTRLLDALCRVTTGLSNRGLTSLIAVAVSFTMYLLVMQGASLLEHWNNTQVSANAWHFFALYPLCKALHELAHGWTLKRFGGHVPEAGVSFVVFFPLPYVDATDAWTLSRSERMLVTAAGMLMDIVVACIAIFLWSLLSAGVVSDMAFSVALMSLVSIVVFNANPLLKFDGYYLLEDALDSPGLSRRSSAFYQLLLKRCFTGVRSNVDTLVARGEKPLLLIYGLASPCYRILICAFICVYLIKTFHELGVLLSAFTIIPLFVLPVLRVTDFFLHSQELNGQRWRAMLKSSLVITLAVIVLFTLPLPSSTRTQGVVWVEEQAEIYAAQSGQLDIILVGNGDNVIAGQPLMNLTAPELELALTRKQAAVNLARLDVERHRQNDPGLAVSARIELDQAIAELAHARDEFEKLIIRSPGDGRFAFSDPSTAQGTNVLQGERLAYVVDTHDKVVRAVVKQSALGQLSNNVEGVHVRLASDMSRKYDASLVWEVPAGTHALPSVALIDTGFGGFDVAPQSADSEARTRDKVFHLELAILGDDAATINAPLGTRVFVTLEHANEPLGPRWIRLGRQLLLKHLSV